MQIENDPDTSIHTEPEKLSQKEMLTVLTSGAIAAIGMNLVLDSLQNALHSDLRTPQQLAAYGSAAAVTRVVERIIKKRKKETTEIDIDE